MTYTSLVDTNCTFSLRMDSETCFVFSKLVVSFKQISVDIIYLAKNTFILVFFIVFLNHFLLLHLSFTTLAKLRVILDVFACLQYVISLWSHEVHSFCQTVFNEVTPIRSFTLLEAYEISLGKTVVYNMPGE